MQADRIYCGDALTVLKTLPDSSVNCCVTSPPYYALRDYGVDGQIGREETPALYVERLTSIFREVRRVLTPDGTLWLNIADTYAGKGNQGDSLDPKYPNGRTGQAVALNGKVEGCKAKDMIGIPWLLAFALRADGWYLRSDIIWMKANPMPESTKDRPSRCYEHIFLLSKSRRYYYDAAAIAEPVAETTVRRMKGARSTATKHGSIIPGQQNIQKNQSAKSCRNLYGCRYSTASQQARRMADQHRAVQGRAFRRFPAKAGGNLSAGRLPARRRGAGPLPRLRHYGGGGKAARTALHWHRANLDYCKLAQKRIEGGEFP